MLNCLLNFFSHPSRRTSHTVAEFTFIRDPEIAKALLQEGYYIADFIEKKQGEQLLELYESNRPVNKHSTGAYSGVISKSIHDSIYQILAPSFERWFKDYKNIVNAFAVKTPGSTSSVPVHQDVTEIDETKHSSINVWLPLETLKKENGTLHIIPRSHHIFVPYRCATIDPLTKNIEHLLSPYFIPVYLKFGQALFFDSRMFHASPPNVSDHNRVVTLCKICPAEADIIVCYRDKEVADSKIELWKCPEDYLVHSEHHDDTIRPDDCEFLGYKNDRISPLTVAEFEKQRKALNIFPKPE